MSSQIVLLRHWQPHGTSDLTGLSGHGECATVLRECRIQRLLEDSSSIHTIV